MSARSRTRWPCLYSSLEWLAARRELLKQEKQLSKQQQRVAAARRELLWVRVTRDHVFDAPGGTPRVADLFAGRSQLIIKHMLNPDDRCVHRLSLEMDAIEGARVKTLIAARCSTTTRRRP